MHWTTKKPLKTRTSCCKREETRPKNKSHVIVIYWIKVTTHISSLNQDSITISCLLTVSKQLERVSDLSKQFCNSLAPSKLLFLTCSGNDLVASRIAKCEASLIAWIFVCDDLVFTCVPCGSSYSRSCFIVYL